MSHSNVRTCDGRPSTGRNRYSPRVVYHPPGFSPAARLTGPADDDGDHRGCGVALPRSFEREPGNPVRSGNTSYPDFIIDLQAYGAQNEQVIGRIPDELLRR